MRVLLICCLFLVFSVSGPIGYWLLIHEEDLGLQTPKTVDLNADSPVETGNLYESVIPSQPSAIEVILEPSESESLQGLVESDVYPVEFSEDGEVVAPIDVPEPVDDSSQEMVDSPIEPKEDLVYHPSTAESDVARSNIGNQVVDLHGIQRELQTLLTLTRSIATIEYATNNLGVLVLDVREKPELQPLLSLLVQLQQRLTQIDLSRVAAIQEEISGFQEEYLRARMAVQKEIEDRSVNAATPINKERSTWSEVATYLGEIVEVERVQESEYSASQSSDMETMYLLMIQLDAAIDRLDVETLETTVEHLKQLVSQSPDLLDSSGSYESLMTELENLELDVGTSLLLASIELVSALIEHQSDSN